MNAKKLSLLTAAGVAIIVACAPATSESDFQHFHPKGKPPSEYTLAISTASRGAAVSRASISRPAARSRSSAAPARRRQRPSPAAGLTIAR